MKYLVLLLVVVAVLWLMRSRSVAMKRRDRPAGDTKPQAMIACTHCGVHLPRSEAVTGADGLYCSEAHRLARGDDA